MPSRHCERVSLPTYDGSERYFWHYFDLPWSALSPTRRELARVQQQLYIAPHAYHYTTIPAFKSIIESQELWLTDYPYLNDSSEVRHGLELAKAVFTDALSSGDQLTREMLQGLLDALADEQPRICVACFSFARDNLTQWKGYGGGASGVAFGISPTDFREGVRNPLETNISPVIYDDQVKRALLEGFVHDWTMLYQRDSRDGDANVHYYSSTLRSHLFDLISTFKDAAFADERELRYVYHENLALFNEYVFMKAPKRFRADGSLVVPYTTTRDLSVIRLHDGTSALPDSEKTQRSELRLVDVIVGPHRHAELAAAGLRELLDANGYSSISVHQSSVPFR